MDCSHKLFFLLSFLVLWISATESATFSLGGYYRHNDLLREELVRLGWQEKVYALPCDYIDMRWSYYPSKESLCVLNESQYVNHFRSNFFLGKSGLTTLMNTLRQRKPELAEEIDSFFPRSYVLFKKENLAMFVDDFERTLHSSYLPPDETNIPQIRTAPLPSLQPLIDGDENFWIVKPSIGTRGDDTFLFNNLESILSHAKSKKKQSCCAKVRGTTVSYHGQEI